MITSLMFYQSEDEGYDGPSMLHSNANSIRSGFQEMNRRKHTILILSYIFLILAIAIIIAWITIVYARITIHSAVENLDFVFNICEMVVIVLEMFLLIFTTYTKLIHPCEDSRHIIESSVHVLVKIFGSVIVLLAPVIVGLTIKSDSTDWAAPITYTGICGIVTCLCILLFVMLKVCCKTLKHNFYQISH